ncbi:hypothetical protein ACFL2Q_13740 [Thermodesulfobacteriota bacterium]
MSRLRPLAKERPDTLVPLKGDQRAGYGRASESPELVRGTGLHRVAIAMKREGTPTKVETP